MKPVIYLQIYLMTNVLETLLSWKKTCNGCHKKDDVHLGNNGSDCQQCHDNNDWGKIQFNHNDDTSFSLQGTHKNLVCEACHLPEVLKNTTPKKNDSKQLEPERTCHDCHQISDVHNGKLGQSCQQCHQQEKWHEQVIFNHDFTLFPLTGSHQLQVCQACHFQMTLPLSNLVVLIVTKNMILIKLH